MVYKKNCYLENILHDILQLHTTLHKNEKTRAGKNTHSTDFIELKIVEGKIIIFIIF